jgi:hypothetical protein
VRIDPENGAIGAAAHRSTVRQSVHERNIV